MASQTASAAPDPTTVTIDGTGVNYYSFAVTLTGYDLPADAGIDGLAVGLTATYDNGLITIGSAVVGGRTLDLGHQYWATDTFGGPTARFGYQWSPTTFTAGLPVTFTLKQIWTGIYTATCTSLGVTVYYTPGAGGGGPGSVVGRGAAAMSFGRWT